MDDKKSIKLDKATQDKIKLLVEETDYFFDEEDAYKQLIKVGVEHFFQEHASPFTTIHFRSQKEINAQRQKKFQQDREELRRKIQESRKKNGIERSVEEETKEEKGKEKESKKKRRMNEPEIRPEGPIIFEPQEEINRRRREERRQSNEEFFKEIQDILDGKYEE